MKKLSLIVIDENKRMRRNYQRLGYTYSYIYREFLEETWSQSKLYSFQFPLGLGFFLKRLIVLLIFKNGETFR